MQYNKATSSIDSSSDFTGTALAFSGSSGANELRWCASGAGGASTASASWPYYTRPGSATLVAEMWAFRGDTDGSKIVAYIGGGTTYNYVLRWNWDALGTFAAAPQFSAFNSTAHTTPTAGDNSVVGGNATDTGGSGTSYIKGNAWGYGVDTGGSQQSPPTNGTSLPPTVAATDGTAGSKSPATVAWIATHFQDLSGWNDYILNGVTPKATTAGFWYWTIALYSGANQSTGTLTPVVTIQYSYS